MALSAGGRESRSREDRDEEVFEIHPIILGGDSLDPANKIVVSRARHIELVRYWNGVIKAMREKARPIE